MTKLHPLILPGKPSPYGPATKIGESDDSDEADEDEEISDSETTDSEDEDND